MIRVVFKRDHKSGYKAGQIVQLPDKIALELVELGVVEVRDNLHEPSEIKDAAVDEDADDDEEGTTP